MGNEAQENGNRKTTINGKNQNNYNMESNKPKLSMKIVISGTSNRNLSALIEPAKMMETKCQYIQCNKPSTNNSVSLSADYGRYATLCTAEQIDFLNWQQENSVYMQPIK